MEHLYINHVDTNEISTYIARSYWKLAQNITFKEGNAIKITSIKNKAVYRVIVT